jgi:Cu-processing system permease protein
MNILFSLAKNTFREAIRDRVLYIIFFFGFLFLVSSRLAGELAAGQEERLITDFGITMIHIFGIFITVFVGSRLIFNEIDKKTIFLLIPKPIPRAAIVLAKFFGLAAVLLIITVLMGIVFFFIVPFSPGMLTILAFLYLSFLLLLSITIFLSTFMSPFLASVSAVLVFLAGHLTFVMKFMAQKMGGPIFAAFANGIYYGFPNFSNLNLKNYILYGIPYTSVDIFFIVLCTLLFIVLFLFFAVLIFGRKEFS